MPSRESYFCSAYGLGIVSDVMLPEFPAERGRAEMAVWVRRFPDGEKPAPAPGSPTEAMFTLGRLGALLVRDGREITVFPAPGVEDSALRPFITGSGMAVLLWQRGLVALHASAIRLDGSAVAFLGSPGAGKSSIAAALHACGHVVLSDDLTAVDPNCTGPTVLPGPSQLRLFPEIAALLGLEGSPDPACGPGQDKCMCRTSNGFTGASVPLRCVYVLSQDAADEIQPLRPREALLDLVRQSYPTRFGSTGGKHHFLRCAHLASSVPFFRLKALGCPRALPPLVGAVQRHLASTLVDHWPPPRLAPGGAKRS